MAAYEEHKSAQQTEFQSVTKILEDALALIAKQDFDNAVNRIGNALAAAQVGLDIQVARDNDAGVDDTVKVQRIMRGVELLQKLAERTLPEAMDTAQFYRQNKPYKINE